MRFCTFPSSSPSSTQNRWLGDTRNIVEQRHPMGSSDITVFSGESIDPTQFIGQLAQFNSLSELIRIRELMQVPLSSSSPTSGTPWRVDQTQGGK